MKKTSMLMVAVMLLVLAACGKPSVEQATNDFCASLQTYGQALAGLENLTPDSTVKEFDSARRTAQQARQNVVKSASNMHDVKMDAIDQAWKDLDKTINSISKKDTLGEAASQVTQSAAAVRAAYDELGRANCPQQFAQEPSNTAAPGQPITSTGAVTTTAPISATAAITAPAAISGTQGAVAAEPTVAGTYTTTLPAADTPGRTITLNINPDGTTSMTTDYMDGQPPVVETGTWQQNSDGTVNVVFVQVDGKTLAMPDVIKFALLKGKLQAVEYDRQVYGSEGLTMQNTSIPAPTTAVTATVAAPAATTPTTPTAATTAPTAPAAAAPAASASGTPLLTGVTWQLQNVQRADGATTTPDDPAAYTLTLQPDGTASAVADCSTGTGTYTTSGSSISFTLRFSQASCPVPTFAPQYMKYLEYADSYKLAGDMLAISYSHGDGTMYFLPGAQ